MVELLWHWLVSLAKSRRRLETEDLFLRHRLNILHRKAPRRLWLSNADRLAFVWLYRLCPAAADAITIIRPETLARWHRHGFRALFWRGRSRPKGGQATSPASTRRNVRCYAETVVSRFLSLRQFSREGTSPLARGVFDRDTTDRSPSKGNLTGQEFLELAV